MNKENILKAVKTFNFDIKDINVYESDLETSETLRNSVNLQGAIQDFQSNIEYLPFDRINNLDDLDELLTDEIIEVSQQNVNIYDYELANNAFFKLEYLEENEYFDDALEIVNNDKEFKEHKLIGLLNVAEYEILKDCLNTYKNEMMKHLSENITQNKIENEETILKEQTL